MKLFYFDPQPGASGFGWAVCNANLKRELAKSGSICAYNQGPDVVFMPIADHDLRPISGERAKVLTLIGFELESANERNLIPICAKRTPRPLYIQNQIHGGLLGLAGNQGREPRQGTKAGNYGVITLQAPRRCAKVHRLAFLWTHGVIDPSLVIDHLCRNTRMRKSRASGTRHQWGKRITRLWAVRDTREKNALQTRTRIQARLVLGGEVGRARLQGMQAALLSGKQNKNRRAQASVGTKETKAK